MAHQPKSEAAFRAEMDANTLAEAEAIKKTPGRMTKAKTAAKRLASEKEKQAQGMRKVAGRKASTAKSSRRRR